jgi:hypothetical protein
MARDLRTGLLREGIPLAYVERVIEELADHAEDIEMESAPAPLSLSGRSARLEARLGSSEDLISHLAHAYRTHSFAGRHCLLWSLGAPILAITLGIVSLFLIGSAGIQIFYRMLDDSLTDAWADTTMYLLIYGSAAVLPLLVAGILARQAICCGLKGRWLWLSCTLVGLLFSLLYVELRLPYAGPGSGQFSIGFHNDLDVRILIQIPLVILLFEIRRYEYRRMKVYVHSN